SLAVGIVVPVQASEFEVMLPAIPGQVIGVFVNALNGKSRAAFNQTRISGDVDVGNALFQRLKRAVAVGGDAEIQAKIALGEFRARVNSLAVLSRTVYPEAEIVEHGRADNPGVAHSQVL